MSSASPAGVDQAPLIIHPTWSTVNTSTPRARVGVGKAVSQGKSPVERTSVIGVGAAPPARRGGTTSYSGEGKSTPIATTVGNVLERSKSFGET